MLKPLAMPVHVMENVSQATPSLNLDGRHLAGVIIITLL
jgi:hypothetical protein